MPSQSTKVSATRPGQWLLTASTSGAPRRGEVVLEPGQRVPGGGPGGLGEGVLGEAGLAVEPGELTDCVRIEVEHVQHAHGELHGGLVRLARQAGVGDRLLQAHPAAHDAVARVALL
jgi:hypothetical protein